MGYQAFEKKSQAQLARHIKSVAKNSIAVFFSGHAKVKMRQRKVSALEVLECLREGTIRRVPEPNIKKDNLECRMERYVAGRELAVIVALSDDDPDLLVVTVFSVG
jgi:hypothetical protein